MNLRLIYKIFISQLSSNVYKFLCLAQICVVTDCLSKVTEVSYKTVYCIVFLFMNSFDQIIVLIQNVCFFAVA